MAEPARDAPTTDKKRSLAIDEDFGKDFLNSWKSSKTGNSMDFDVETVPQNGKSSFNFDKLDDFDLGDGFKKLSSFQMDITDIDFSVPLKKTAKANSKQSLGKQELKNDKFSFMFDFNELDKFDFDTKMTETEIPSSKCTKYSVPPCTDEVLKEDKCLELKSDLVDGCHSESHGDEGLPNTNSLATSTCAPTLKPDGQSHNTATIHESAKETLTLVTNIFASDSVKGNVSTDHDSVVRSFNSSPSRYSSPVKSSNSRSCPLKSKTGSEDCVMAPQNDEVDQHEVSGGNKYSNVSAQVCNEVVGGSMKVVMQKYVDTPRNNSSDNTSSPLLVQDISHKDDKGHSAKLMTLSAIKTAGAFERNLTSKLIVSSITTKLPSKRKTFEEPLTDPKVFDTSKHINFSPNRRVNSSSPAKSITPNLLSAASMSSPKNSPIEGQDIQKDGSKSSPNLMTLRMIKGNNTISNSSMSKEANLVERTKGNLASKSIASFTTEKHALPSSLLKMKTIKDPFINLKAFNSFKRINSSPERESILISPGNGADMAQRAENPECSKDEACLEKPNGATELESMEFEVPVLIENNGNAEKAESYSKELEDLCVILKKKHEEAKELLVRALVNNNKLLMLNHPMIEEKIRVLQRFASSLQCREHWKL